MIQHESPSSRSSYESENKSLPKPTVQDEAGESTAEHCKGDFTVTAASESTVPVEESHPRDMKTWKWVLLSGGVLFATILLALDNTVVADLQPQVVDAFGEISKFPRINVNYSLGAVGTGLLW